MHNTHDESSAAPIKLLRETLEVGTRVTETGRVQIEITTQTTDQPTELTQITSNVEVVRHEINRMLDRDEAVPQQTMRDGITIIPILEEIIVAEKRLVLLGELHLITKTTAETVISTIALRKYLRSLPGNPVSTRMQPFSPLTRCALTRPNGNIGMRMTSHWLFMVHCSSMR